jgi:hypothetical protein
MPNFVVIDRASPRFLTDFQVNVDPTHTCTDEESAYLADIVRLLDRLATDQAADRATNLRDTLRTARKDWRDTTCAKLRAEADNFAAGTIDARQAIERNAAIESDYVKNNPDVNLVPAKTEQFTGQSDLSRSAGFNPDPAEQAYLNQLKELLATFEKEDADDASANYSEAALAARRGQRTDATKELKKDFVYWKEGLDSQVAAGNVSFITGSYRALRERLGRPLFSIQVIPGEANYNTDLTISVEPDLPAPDNVPSSDKQELYVQIMNAKTVIHAVCRQVRSRATKRFFKKKGEEQRGLALLGEYINELAAIGRLGLEGPHTGLAKLALASLKAEFVASEAEEIMNRYVRRLGFWAGSFALAFLFVYCLIRYNACTTPCVSWWDAHKTFLLAGTGAAVGTWASFSVRQVNLTFEQLASPEEDLLDAPLRILFVVALTLTVCLLFWTGAINIEIGNLKTGPDSFKAMGSIGILIGMFCGLSERALATAISGRAAAFVRGVGSGG